MIIYEVEDRNEPLLAALLSVWESSVRATHLFLSDEEVKKIKEYVPLALQSVEHLFVAGNTFDEPVAFMGIEDNRLEMLFLLPRIRGKGAGKCKQWCPFRIGIFTDQYIAFFQLAKLCRF